MAPKAGFRNRLFRAVHAEARKRRMDHDAIHDMCREKFGAESMSKLTDGQLLTIYRDWTGHGLKTKAALPKRGEVGTKELAVMATAGDLEMLEAEFAKRGLGPDGKRSFIKRQLNGGNAGDEPAGWDPVIGRWWCRMFHGQPMWPMHGRYICRRCFRVFRLDWEVISGK